MHHFRGGANSYTPNVFLPININLDTVEYIDKVLFSRCKHFFTVVVGIKKVDEYELWLDDIKTRVEDGYDVSDEQHVKDIITIHDYITSSDYSNRIKDVIGDILRVRCLVNERIVWCNPIESECYFPQSVYGDNKAYFEGIKEVKFLDAAFYKKNEIEPQILERLYVRNDIFIANWFNCCFINLDKVIEFINHHPKEESSIKKSQTIFLVLRKNANSTFDLSLLIKSKWLYSQNKQLVCPNEISKFELNEEIYGKVDLNSLLYERLLFAKNEIDARYEALTDFAQTPKEHRDAFLEHEIYERYGISSIAELEKVIERHNVDDFRFPTYNVKNWRALSDHAAVVLYNADEVKYARVLRQVRVSNNPTSAKVYLKNMYKSDYDNKYACQMCHKGFDNIESCQIESKGKAKLELPQLYLCMCPTCADKFKRLKNNDVEYGRFLSPLKCLTQGEIEKDSVIKLHLYDEEIWFTQTHAAEISLLFSLMQGDKKVNRDTLKESVGFFVEHKKFGRGKIISCVGDDIKIQFETYGEQTISVQACLDKDLLIFVD